MMKRTLNTFGMFLVSLLLGGSPALAPRDDRSAVTFDVAVTDKHNNSVLGLGKDRFRIFENDVEQTIIGVRTADKHATVVILMEFSDTFGGYYQAVSAPVWELIRSLQQTDWIALVTFDVTPNIITDFTRDRGELFDGLSRLQMPFYRESSVYDAVYFVLERLEEVEGKKVIFLFSTGLDTISRHGYLETLRKAEAADATIYSIGMTAFAIMTDDPFDDELAAQIRPLQADNTMRSLAEATGGLVFFPLLSGQYRDIYETAIADFSHRYSVDYIPRNPISDGAFRRLKVEVMDTDVDGDGKADKLKVQHKKGYYLKTSDP
jgi:VWFA-related protein